MDVSIAQLSELTGKSYRTLTPRLESLTYKVEGRSYLYESKEALELIYRTGDINYNVERARLTKAQADEKELQVKILEADLIPSERVAELLESVIANARAKLLSLPVKVAQIAINATEVREIEQDIQLLIYESLKELSNGSGGNTGTSAQDMGTSSGFNS